jgi:hypothetical protein
MTKIQVLYRDFYSKIESELNDYFSSGIKGPLLRKHFRNVTEDFLRELKQSVFITLRTADPIFQDQVKELAAPILKGFTHLAESVESEVLYQLRNPKNKRIEDQKNAIKAALGTTEHLARTLSLTGNGAMDRIKNITDALEAGFTLFKYIGPAPERKFCKEHFGKTYSIQEMLLLDNGTGRKGKTKLPVVAYGGGYNCRHEFAPVTKSEEAKKTLQPPPDEQIGAIQQGNQTPNFYKDLTDKQKEAYNAIKKAFDIEFREDFYKDDFENGLKVSKMSRGFAFASGNQISVNESAYPTKGTIKKVLVHEGGHVRHNSQNLIDTGTNKISPEIEKEFNKHQKEIKALLNDRTDNFKKGRDIYAKIMYKTPDDFINLSKEFKIENIEARQLVSAMADYFGALTKNKVGYGHYNNYYKNKSKQAAEWFAHCSENYYLGNPIFEKEFPDFYKLTIKFMERLNGKNS